jgi:hypothetical protein
MGTGFETSVISSNDRPSSAPMLGSFIMSQTIRSWLFTAVIWFAVMEIVTRVLFGSWVNLLGLLAAVAGVLLSKFFGFAMRRRGT